jgi:hypothetical protein
MELRMYVDNDCIDSLPIERCFIILPGYIGHCVKLLRRRHEALIMERNCEPDFCLFSRKQHAGCNWILRVNTLE